MSIRAGLRNPASLTAIHSDATATGRLVACDASQEHIGLHHLTTTLGVHEKAVVAMENVAGIEIDLDFNTAASILAERK